MVNDGVETVISTARTTGHKISSGTINRKLNAIDTFSFSINPKNPAWGKLFPKTTTIIVRDMRGVGVIEFKGKVTGSPTGDMSEDGTILLSVECEGPMAYLRDSIQRHGEHHNITPKDYLALMIDAHNSQVDSSKQFVLGECDVTDSNDSIYRYRSYGTTLDTILDDLVGTLGGYIKVYGEEAPYYIDYTVESGAESEMSIEVAKNIMSMQHNRDLDEICTKLIPLGAEYDSAPVAIQRLTDAGVITNQSFWLEHYNDVPWLEQLIINMGEFNYGASNSIADVEAAIMFLEAGGVINSADYWRGIYNSVNNLSYLLRQAAEKIDTTAGKLTIANASKPRLTIAEVNGGKDYILDNELVSQYGIIEKAVKWDDVTVASNLLTKGKEWLEAQTGTESVQPVVLNRQFLKNANADEQYILGYYYKPVNGLFGLKNEYFQMTEQTIDIFNPQRSTLTLGEKPLTLTNLAPFYGALG